MLFWLLRHITSPMPLVKWVTEEIGDSLGCEYVSIALDSSNKVHFSYLKSNCAFDYAIKNSDSWIITTFDNGTWVGFLFTSN